METSTKVNKAISKVKQQKVNSSHRDQEESNL